MKLLLPRWQVKSMEALFVLILKALCSHWLAFFKLFQRFEDLEHLQLDNLKVLLFFLCSLKLFFGTFTSHGPATNPSNI